jgi:predicted nucleic-acid-binding protein
MRTGAKRYAVDANVIIRFLTRDLEEHWAKAHALMQQMTDGSVVMVCDPAVLSEVVWTLRSFYKLSVPEVKELVEPIVKADGFHVPDKDRYVPAVKLYGTSVSDWGDACLCAAALEQCEGRVLSFDKGIKDVEGIVRMDSV